MSVVDTVRHRAGIAGYVTDAQSGNALAGVVVKISAQDLRTLTRADGFFYFLDLQPGEYTLDVEAPDLGSRYGAANVPGVVVQNEADGRPVFDVKANMALPPTMVTGKVTRSADGQPLENAVVQVLGSEEKAVTDKNGNYVLSPLQAGMPNVQVSATGYVAVIQKVTLTAGLEASADFSLARS